MSGTDEPAGDPLAECGMTSQEIQLWYALAEVAGQLLQLPQAANRLLARPGFGPLAGQGTRSDELQNGRLRGLLTRLARAGRVRLQERMDNESHEDAT